MDAKQPARIQFTLRDLLLTVALLGFALFVVHRLATARGGELPPEACVIITVLTLIGATAGVLWTRKDPRSRSYYIFGWVCTFWVVGGVAAAFIETATRSGGHGCENPA